MERKEAHSLSSSTTKQEGEEKRGDLLNHPSAPTKLPLPGRNDTSPKIHVATVQYTDDCHKNIGFITHSQLRIVASALSLTDYPFSIQKSSVSTFAPISALRNRATYIRINNSVYCTHL